VAAIQVDYAVFSRDIEGPEGSNLLSTCRELGVALVGATPLGRGILTTNFVNGEAYASNDKRPYMPRFNGSNLEANREVARKFKNFADRKGCTPAQLALAWLLKQGDDIIPIPGTKRIKYLEENWAALNVDLTDDEDREIKNISNVVKFVGDPAPAMFMPYLCRDTKEESI
jgi:aryl-alcohol dehydrogenase-like predicted oxidoreductase